jgi:hypothetical protein
MKTKWRIGENVPWSVSWTGEQRFQLRPSTDFPGYTDLIQSENPGVGTPKFAALHATRHRAGMRDHLCHVCGRRTLARDRYIFPVHSGNFVTITDGSARFAGNVPPVHLACGKRAALQCPHLSHGSAQPIAYPSEPSILVPRPDVPEGMQEIASTLPKHLKIVFASLRIYGPRFTRTIEKLRTAHTEEAVLF